ncbi:CRISPR-associated helicase Cas3' [Lachnoanaerobaculum gingivalis]|uniref:CRISPR-associated helicase Cas3 n=1 Tax=Lachnoanaerobaculum gingivalis TaxID=2490855 RepID=A0A3P3R297_9FIRM|nr:CRISPR-associated helicase Cas3' [Lachnoanaerobaculum gingivalis]RRJ26723.1 CRISPR-associated helicase Cas3' [Lachnoanaerobaculum gingivalis]
MEIKDELAEIYKKYKAKENETIYEHTKNLLSKLEELKEIVAIEDIDLIAEACIFHDFAKVNPLFQRRLEAGKKLDENEEIGHNILSFYMAKNYLEQYSKEDRNIILYAILNHHNYVDNFETVDKKQDLISANLKSISTEVFKDDEINFFKNIGLRELAVIRKLRMNPSKRSILVKGFLHKCDYAASAHSKIDMPNIHLESRLEKLKEDFVSKGVSDGWNKMQRFARDNKDSNIILIGSTGLGKTEASLLWIGNNKGFYVLPLKTAINAMYRRIRNTLYKDDYTENLGLLHGELENIYLEDESQGTLSSETEESMKFWEYYGLTRAMSLPVTITTPDQVFRFAFKYCSYELQLATYSYSKMVIDEIQAYSPDILATLIYSLQLIDMVGGKFAITTATLPPFIKDLLQEDIDKKIEYKEDIFLNNKIRHRVSLRHSAINIDDIKDFIEDKYHQESMKLLVVVNTVTKAQSIYREIKSWLDENDIEIEMNLLHSKFTVQHRSEKEDAILKDGESKCKKRVIWISTQVVEASLDIDFDYLFTELSDLSSLLQRLGRCNRKGLKSVDEFNSYVYLDIDENLLIKHSDKNAYASSGIIYKSLYELSKAALLEWESENNTGLFSEADKNRLIENYFTKKKIEEYDKMYSSIFTEYLSEYKRMYKHLVDIIPDSKNAKEVIKEFRNIISRRVIPQSIYEDKQENIIEIIDEIEEKRKLIGRTKSTAEKQKLRVDILRLKNEFRKFTLNISLRELDKDKDYCVVDNEKIIISTRVYNKEYGIIKEKEGSGSIFL